MRGSICISFRKSSRGSFQVLTEVLINGTASGMATKNGKTCGPISDTVAKLSSALSARGIGSSLFIPFPRIVYFHFRHRVLGNGETERSRGPRSFNGKIEKRNSVSKRKECARQFSTGFLQNSVAFKRLIRGNFAFVS